jgi:hypothetical protein
MTKQTWPRYVCRLACLERVLVGPGAQIDALPRAEHKAAVADGQRQAMPKHRPAQFRLPRNPFSRPLCS